MRLFRLARDVTRQRTRYWTIKDKVTVCGGAVRRYSAAATHTSTGWQYAVGDEVSGFVVRRVEEVPELHLTALRLEHRLTGADYLHVARADSNNVFCVGLRTTPRDSTGVPHILEHIALCGSHNYPCRDPFFKMLNRSLSTFMNALTGSDYTMYPFSTQNPVDFRNLMSVYMDAVFRPNLSQLDFLQEGWRLEHQDIQDKSSPIVFKGVVFNEMKGVFADSQQLFMQKLQNGLLPSHTYGVVSGGDPLVIPHLTWEQLRHFHAYHYHPSNARFFTYGDQPLADHLAFIHDNYLSSYAKIDPKTEVPEEPGWSEPRMAHVQCGLDPLAGTEAQTSMTVSYKLVDIKRTFESFVLVVLGELLMSGPNAPFYKSLLEPQLGNSFSPSCGYDTHTRSTTFTVGLQGMREQNVDRVRQIIDDTFLQVATEGFPAERVEAVLHNFELSIKHQTSSFGLALVMGLMPQWNLDGDPIEALQVNHKIEKFRKVITENPNYLQEKIRQYFLDNTHKYTLTMSPREGYEESLKEKEEELLAEKLAVLTDKDLENIWQQGKTLASKQEQEEDLSSLPTLHVSDISRDVPTVPLSHTTLAGGVPLQLCSQPTNGITYFSAIFDTAHVGAQLMPLVPLLCGVLTRMGAADLDFRSLDQRIELTTGGLSVSGHVCPHPIHFNEYEQGVMITSHCLNHNLEKMLDIWDMILNAVTLDDMQRFKTLVNMIATDQANSLVFSGHRYAMSAACASTGYVAALSDSWKGLCSVKQMKALSEEEDLQPCMGQLQELTRQVLSKEKMRVAINTTPDNCDTSITKLDNFLQRLSGTPSRAMCITDAPCDFTPHTCRTHHVFPFPVNFASKAYPGVPYAHPDAGALRVLARLMFRFLHREIREKGGAYGGGAMATPGGPFSFYSYRDPHSTQTLATFDAAVEWVLSGSFKEQDVNEAKLGVFQSVDAPVAPGSQGARTFQSGITDQLFADHRRMILDVVPQDLVRVARIYLREATVEGACLIGPHNDTLAQDQFWDTVQN